MKARRGFLDIFDRLADRLLCVLGAILFSQGPEFMQQYLQRLGGSLDEARRQLAIFEQTAAQAGLSLDRFIAHTAATPDPAVARLAGVMSGAIDRVAALQSAYEALLHASPWTRPFVFFGHLDPGIAQLTGAVYRPAVPTTLEGLAYALAGMAVFLALYHLGLKRGLALLGRRLPAPKAPDRSAA